MLASPLPSFATLSGSLFSCSQGHPVCVQCAQAGTNEALARMDDSLSCLAVANCTSSYAKKETVKFLTPPISLRMKNLKRDLRKGKAGWIWSLFTLLWSFFTFLWGSNSVTAKRVRKLEEDMTRAMVKNCPGKCQQPFVHRRLQRGPSSVRLARSANDAEIRRFSYRLFAPTLAAECVTAVSGQPFSVAGYDRTLTLTPLDRPLPLLAYPAEALRPPRPLYKHSQFSVRFSVRTAE